MPYHWVRRPEEAPEKSGASSREPVAELVLWPHRSLPRTGFAGFIAATAALLSLPLFAVLGTKILWGLLPFIVLNLVAGSFWFRDYGRLCPYCFALCGIIEQSDIFSVRFSGKLGQFNTFECR